MTNSLPIRRAPRPSEQGYVLLAVIFLVALLTISLAIAVPKVTKEIQLDRERETMQRGKQYARAVKMYYKKFGAYPPNIDALVKPTNNIRFLRKKYTDLTTGRPDWKPVLFGQNKAPTAMGFFGQVLGGVGGCAVTNPVDAGSASSLNSNNSNCVGTGQNTDTTQTGATTTTSTASTDPSAANNGAATSTSAFSQTGQTFGGAGIIGFSPNSPKQSIMIYKKKDHYNEWEFVYDPKADLMQAQGALQGGVQTGGSAGFNQPSTTQSTTPQTTPSQ
jgi:type II secretory pathway pseudopilin PulG